MRLPRSLFLLLVLSNSIIAQVKIIEKEYAENKLSYKIQTNFNYFVQNLGAKNKIIFPEFIDESKPGELSIPSHDIFLAIPPNSSPLLKYTILEQIEINGLPELNPEIISQNEKFIYSKAEPKKSSFKKLVENKGTLWINNNFCIHLKINPFIYNSNNRLTHIKKIELVLFFKDVIINNRNNFGSIHESILDKEIAKNIIGQPNYLIQNTTNWINFSNTYFKLGTAEDGIYRLKVNDLENNGIIVSSINPKTFKLYLKGEEIPIFVEGENDLSFDQNDYIEFVGIRNMGGNHHAISPDGEPYNEYLGRYTDTTVYWLTWDGELGKRIKMSDGETSQITDTLYYYSQIDHYEINRWYDFATPNQVEREKPFWSSNKTWHEGNINVGISNRNFLVSDVYPDYMIKLSVKLQDFASDILSNSHLFSLSLNSTNIWSDSTYVDKYKIVVLSTQQSSNLLNIGNNNLKIHSIQTNASINTCIFDWYEIEYPRYLKPFNDSLNFSFPFLENEFQRAVKIHDVATSSFSIWKYGDNYRKYNVSKEDNDVIFADTISGSDKFIFIDETKIRTPKIYYAKQFKNLKNPENQVDYIAITHKKFSTKVDDYAEFISQAYDLNTQKILIDDVYDEFSYGFFNPEAIKEFLMATHQHWQPPKPKFVSLIGGATYDYYGNKFKNINSVVNRTINYVPSFGAPVSDNWFVIWDTTGAYIPQMNIGRIPVKTNEEFEWYFEKHKNYLGQEFSDWNKRYLFFSSGDSKNVSELNLLYDANQFVIDNYVTPKPIGGVSSHFYKTIEPKSNFGPITDKEFQSSIDNGAVFISYLGHSGTQIWDNSITSPLQLKNNENKYPIVSDFGCSTGKFAESDITSFSELFTVNEDGQALAYIGNSSLGFLSTAVLAPKLFYKKILKEKFYNVSKALQEAKIEMLQNYGSSGVYELFALTNTLLGDPIISLPIPEKPNYVINESNVFYKGETVTDQQDSIKFTILYNNYGTAIDDSITLKVSHIFNNTLEYLTYLVPTPNYEDSVIIVLPIKNQPGNHIVEIILDPEDNIEELAEADNTIQFSFNVASSLIRPKLDYQMVNGISNSITFFNPTLKPNNNLIVLELSDDPSFMVFEKQEHYFDSLTTEFRLGDLIKNKRFWGRTKIKDDNNYSPIFSFMKADNKFYIGDSLSISKSKLTNSTNFQGHVALDTQTVKFEIFSAGFDDGQAAIISRNGVNFVPTPVVGHHVSLFNSEAPFDFISYHYFNTYAGGQNITDYIQFLDTLSNKYLVAIAISDEGSPKSDELRNQIKSLGSQFIDNVGFRSSWAIIGQKGAVIGSVPEVFSTSGTGAVKIDTIYSYLSEYGNVLIPLIGPSTKWKNIEIVESLPNNSTIKYSPILVDEGGIPIDTLDGLPLVEGLASLSHIDAKKYPYIKILAEFEAGDNNISPELYSLGVDYVGIPELAINYQVVSLEKDTLQQGEDANLSFYVYNVGESVADSFKVIVEVVKPDNSKEKVFEEIVDSLGSEKRKKFNLLYPTTNFNGSRTFAISIDAEDRVHELYEDNNFYNIRFYVIGDTTKPSMNLTIDGNDIFDGEYISNNPEIKIELSDPSLIPITDTSSINIFLNNRYISYKGNEELLSINYSATNPKAVVNYKPTLEDGEYILRVFGKDASGNIGDSSGITKNFNVESSAKLLNVYNYPNPFFDDTYFTFKLTQIPDEIKIKVFTVAGRLIKEIVLNNAQLNFDLNKIHWDGRDEDGDKVGNGVYLYKVIMEVDGKKQDVTQKLAVVR